MSGFQESTNTINSIEQQTATKRGILNKEATSITGRFITTNLGGVSFDGVEGVLHQLLADVVGRISFDELFRDGSAEGFELLKERAHVNRVHDDLAGGTLGDLDLVVVDVVVVVEFSQGGDGHDLRNGAEEEDRGFLQGGHVVKAVRDVAESIADHGVAAFNGTSFHTRLLEVSEFVGELTPNRLGPEHARRFLDDVFEVVTGDVDLLEEETHGVGDGQILGDGGIFETGEGEEASETVTNKASDIVAVLIVVGVSEDISAGFEEVEHTMSHLFGDVRDDFLVFLLELEAFTRNTVELFKEFAFLAFTDSLAAPLVIFEVLVEGGEDLLFGFEGDGHVVFDGVKTTEGEVEEGDGVTKFRVELDDDNSEGAADFSEDVIAELEIFLIVSEVNLDVGVLHLDANHREEFINTKKGSHFFF